MKKKIFGLLGIGIIIIVIVICIVSCGNKSETKKENDNVYTCIKKSKDDTEIIKHIIELDKKSLSIYTINERYKLEKKSDYEKKCYEEKMEETNIKSSKDVDFKQTASCNNKKKIVTVKRVYTISELSDAGKKSLSKLLENEKDGVFNIEAWQKSQKKEKFKCE